ncbi:MAG: tetratricopeptide repeat protein [Bacteroidota bacterium]
MRTPPEVCSAGRLRAAGLLLAFLLAGCGTVEESMDSSWPPPVSPVALTRLEFRADSLGAANTRLQQQILSLTSENRSLNARAAELEMRLNEALAAPKPPPPPADFSSAYAAAYAQYRRRDFAGAAAAFDALLKGGIGESLADNCRYWMGESYYGMGRYREALGEFDAVLGFARSEKTDDAQMMIGNCHLGLRDRASARAAFELLATRYPASPYAPRAREKAAGLR